jgi:hypothetical protein
MNRDELELFAHVVPQRCGTRWSEMKGTEKARFCTRCCHDVHSAEALSVEETTTLVKRAQAARLFLRQDGTVKVKECPRPLLARAVEFVPKPSRTFERVFLGIILFLIASVATITYFGDEIRRYFGATVESI